MRIAWLGVAIRLVHAPPRPDPDVPDEGGGAERRGRARLSLGEQRLVLLGIGRGRQPCPLRVYGRAGHRLVQPSRRRGKQRMHHIPPGLQAFPMSRLFRVLRQASSVPGAAAYCGIAALPHNSAAGSRSRRLVVSRQRFRHDGASTLILKGCAVPDCGADARWGQTLGCDPGPRRPGSRCGPLAVTSSRTSGRRRRRGPVRCSHGR